MQMMQRLRLRKSSSVLCFPFSSVANPENNTTFVLFPCSGLEISNVILKWKQCIRSRVLWRHNWSRLKALVALGAWRQRATGIHLRANLSIAHITNLLTLLAIGQGGAMSLTSTSVHRLIGLPPGYNIHFSHCKPLPTRRKVRSNSHIRTDMLFQDKLRSR